MSSRTSFGAVHQRRSDTLRIVGQAYRILSERSFVATTMCSRGVAESYTLSNVHTLFFRSTIVASAVLNNLPLLSWKEVTDIN